MFTISALIDAIALDSVDDEWRAKLNELLAQLKEEMDAEVRVELSAQVMQAVHTLANRGAVAKSDVVATAKPDVLSGETVGEVLASARKYAIQQFAGKTVVNKSDQSSIVIAKSGIEHALSRRAGIVNAMVATDLENMLRGAQWLRTTPDKSGRKEIKAAHFYGCKVEISGRIVEIGIVVREHEDGRRYYDHFELKTKSPARAGDSGAVLDGTFETTHSATVEELGHRPKTRNGRILAQSSTSVNGALDSVSPLARVKLLGDLSRAVADLQAAANPIARVQAAKAVTEILAKLGVNSDVEGEVSVEDDGELSDDPNSPNYRYRDTGYIADSRKEKAASMIFEARKTGQRLRVTDIDFDAIEQNPRQAEELIVKANLFGKPDWEAMQASGMEPGAGFLIDKIYASIGPKPTKALPSATAKELQAAGLSIEQLQQVVDSADDLARTRKDYAAGLETIRNRLEVCKTVDDVMEVINDIKGELFGKTMTAEQSAKIQVLQQQHDEAIAIAKEKDREREAVYEAWQAAENEFSPIRLERERRERRRLKPDPEIEAKFAELSVIAERKRQDYVDFKAQREDLQNKQRRLGRGVSYLNDYEYAARLIYNQIREIEQDIRYANLLTNPATRAWLSFGERFLALMNYRHHRGSNAFSTHVTSVRMGKIKDWSWADKEKPAATTKKPTAENVNFQMRVAETSERIGGKHVRAESTLALKEMLGFRDVQSGNWVLRDVAAAKFHVEQTAGAMSDMADILGIDMKYLGLGGRLAMAFGARGTGGKNAARAHYEPVHRVINLTKMGGGGSLGHEHLHAIDNLLPSIMNGAEGSKTDFASKNPELLPAGKVREAFVKLKNAITVGDRALTQTFMITQADRDKAKLNLDDPRGPLAREIKAAGNSLDAVKVVNNYFAGMNSKANIKRAKEWRTIAAAYFAPAGETAVTLPIGRRVSNFMAEAQILDNGIDGKYWSQIEEMTARAFQAYLEDRLQDQGRKNDYLSAFADNKYHVGPLTGIEWKPFPEGEERTRFNAIFDEVFSALREEKVFEKATANTALLDSIFGKALDAVDTQALAQAQSPLDKVAEAKAVLLALTKPVPQTETAAFKAWFGNSKVVDAEGKPLVVYHGTSQDVTTFNDDLDNIASGKLGRGIYIAPSPAKANFFARLRESDGAPNIMPLYAVIKKPFEIYGEASLPVNKIDHKALIEAGYDGVILYEESGAIHEATVFRANQLKSAIGNKGTFDPNGDNILDGLK